jgi:hypothetical protein
MKYKDTSRSFLFYSPYFDEFSISEVSSFMAMLFLSQKKATSNGWIFIGEI